MTDIDLLKNENNDIDNTNAKNQKETDSFPIKKPHSFDVNLLKPKQLLVRSAVWIADKDEFYIKHEIYDKHGMCNVYHGVPDYIFEPGKVWKPSYTCEMEKCKSNDVCFKIGNEDFDKKSYWYLERVEYNDHRFDEEEALDLIGHYRPDLFELIINHYTRLVHISRQSLHDIKKRLWRTVIEYKNDRDLLMQWTWHKDIKPNLTHFIAILTHRLYTVSGNPGARQYIKNEINLYNKEVSKFIPLPKTIKMKPEYILHIDDELDMLQLKRPDVFDEVVIGFAKIVPLIDVNVLLLINGTTKPQRSFKNDAAFFASKNIKKNMELMMDKYYSMLLKRAIRLSILPVPPDPNRIIQMELRGYDQSMTMTELSDLPYWHPDPLDYLQYYQSDLFLPLLDHYCKTRKLDSKVQNAMRDSGLRIQGAKYDYAEEKKRKINGRTWETDIVPAADFYFHYLWQRECLVNGPPKKL